jgi:hypothetical protein
MSAKVGEAEFAMLEEYVRTNGLTLSEWVRDVRVRAMGVGISHAF